MIQNISQGKCFIELFQAVLNLESESKENNQAHSWDSRYLVALMFSRTRTVLLPACQRAAGQHGLILSFYSASVLGAPVL